MIAEYWPSAHSGPTATKSEMARQLFPFGLGEALERVKFFPWHAISESKDCAINKRFKPIMIHYRGPTVGHRATRVRHSHVPGKRA